MKTEATMYEPRRVGRMPGWLLEWVPAPIQPRPYHGLVCYDWPTDRSLMAVVPVHLLLGGWLRMWWWLRSGFGQGPIAKAHSDGYSQGFGAGYDMGRRHR